MSEDLLAREAEAFAAFEEAVAAVPADRREEPALPEDWSMKDVLWHLAHWWRDGEETYRAIQAGTYVESTLSDGEIDARNAAVLEESRSMSLEEVETGARAAREAMLAAFMVVADRPVALEQFSWETIEHYDEHLEAVRGLGAG